MRYNPEMLIEWDDGNWPKCGSHGVSRTEIETVFAHDPIVFPDSEHSQREERLKAIGRTDGGRYVFIVFTIRSKADGLRYRPISARFMHGDEVEYYEKAAR